MPANPFKSKQFKLTTLDRQALDPANGVDRDIDLWCQLYLNQHMFPWQRYFYHHPARNKMCVAGIRVGKSAGIARMFCHYGMYHPNTRLLNTSISSEQAKIVYSTMMEIFGQKRLSHWVKHTERSPYPKIELWNGTEYWFRSIGYEAELLRGFEFDWINIDECGYVTSKMAIDTLKGRLLGVHPTTGLPRAGIFTQMTSPKGNSGWVMDRWKQGDPRYDGADPHQYLSLRVKTEDNPLLSPQQIRDLMAEYTDRMIRQELMGEFIGTEHAEFSAEMIAYCHDDSHPEIRALLKAIEESYQKNTNSLRSQLGLVEDIEHYELSPQPGHQYLASWDLGKKATKAGRNATVGMVWDITEMPWRMVAYRYETGQGYLAAVAWIEEWHRKYSLAGTPCYTVLDATGKGDVVNEILEAEHRVPVDGLVYSSVLKPNLITSARLAIEGGLVRFPFIRRMVDQLLAYEQNDKALAQDIVMAFAQAMQRAREMTGVQNVGSLTTSSGVSYRRAPMLVHPHTRRTVERRLGSYRSRTGR